jgi:hypothetical protein
MVEGEGRGSKEKPSGHCGYGGSIKIHYSVKRAAAMEMCHILLRDLLFKNTERVNFMNYDDRRREGQARHLIP